MKTEASLLIGICLDSLSLWMSLTTLGMQICSLVLGVVSKVSVANVWRTISGLSFGRSAVIAAKFVGASITLLKYSSEMRKVDIRFFMPFGASLKIYPGTSCKCPLCRAALVYHWAGKGFV